MHRYNTVRFKDKISHYCEGHTSVIMLGSGTVPSLIALQKSLKYMDI